MYTSWLMLLLLGIQVSLYAEILTITALCICAYLDWCCYCLNNTSISYVLRILTITAYVYVHILIDVVIAWIDASISIYWDSDYNCLCACTHLDWCCYCLKNTSISMYWDSDYNCLCVCSTSWLMLLLLKNTK
jgi:hypothetical protein